MYRAFGLNLTSDIDLLELLEVKGIESNTDLKIIKKNVKDYPEQLINNKNSFFINENFICFQIKSVGIFMVEKGCQISFWPLEEADEDLIRLYLLGSCMGAILLQRKILPLHGSAVEVNGKAYAIVGDSGAGKSTLASALMKMGCKLITDDVIPVTLNSDNIPIVTPAYPHQKLWLESLNAFGMNSANYKSIFNRETKYSIPVNNQFVHNPLPLSGVIELNKYDGSEVILKPLNKLSCLQTLYNHTYRNFYISQMGLTEWHFKTTAALAEKINIFQLNRPADLFTANDLARKIVEVSLKGETING